VHATTVDKYSQRYIDAAIIQRLEASKSEIEDMLKGYVGQSVEKAIAVSHTSHDNRFKAYLYQGIATSISAHISMRLTNLSLKGSCNQT
jgi:hypothetical protein